MRPCFFLESLEPRITLSAGFLAADGIPGGAVELDLGQEPLWTAFVIQSDGKILASDYNDQGYSVTVEGDDAPTAECSDDQNTFFVRFNPDGSRDSQFGHAGIVNLGCQEPFDQLLLQPDGKILAMGDMTGIRRFTPDVRTDPTFHTTVPPLPIPNFDSYDFERIAIAPDGRIFSGGQAWVEPDDFSSYLGLLSFNSDGTRDLSFGNRGALSAKYALPFGWAHTFAIQSDGKILISTGDHGDDEDKRPGTLLRFNPDGTPDENFASHGQFRFSAHETRGPILLQPDGKIIQLLSRGDNDTDPRAPDLTLLRLNPDGTLDHSFGVDGRSAWSWQGHNWWRSILQPDGKILAIDYDGIIARFTSTGLLDPTFGFGGSISLGSADPDSGLAIDAQFLRPDGHLLLMVQNEQQSADGTWYFSEHLVDITTDTSQPSQPSSADGSIVIRPFAPESVTTPSSQSLATPPFVSLQSPAESDSALPVLSQSTSDVLDQDTDDPFNADDVDAELWLD